MFQRASKRGDTQYNEEKALFSNKEPILLKWNGKNTTCYDGAKKNIRANLINSFWK